MNDYVKIQATDPATGGMTTPVYFMRTDEGLVQVTDPETYRRLDSSQLKSDSSSPEGQTFKDGTPKIVDGVFYIVQPDGMAYRYNDQKLVKVAEPSQVNTLPNAAPSVSSGDPNTVGGTFMGRGGGTAGGQPVGAGQLFTPSQSAQVMQTQTAENEQLNQTLANSGLTPDQQEALKKMFNIISSGDADMQKKLEAAFVEAEKIADPYFKQQIRMLKDTLQRGFVRIDEDLQFREQQLQTRLQDLQADVANAKGTLSLDQTQQLKQLERQYTLTLQGTRENMAARGFTSSTRRTEAETLLEQQTGELRESSRRQFGARLLELQNQADRGNRDAEAELARLQKLAADQKTDMFRQAEAQLGSGDLPPLAGAPAPLGEIVGEIPAAKNKDALQAASSFIF